MNRGIQLMNRGIQLMNRGIQNFSTQIAMPDMACVCL